MNTIPALNKIFPLREDSLDKQYTPGDLDKADQASRAPFDAASEKVINDYVVRLDRISKMSNSAEKRKFFADALRQFAQEFANS